MQNFPSWRYEVSELFIHSLQNLTSPYSKCQLRQCCHYLFTWRLNCAKWQRYNSYFFTWGFKRDPPGLALSIESWVTLNFLSYLTWIILLLFKWIKWDDDLTFTKNAPKLKKKHDNVLLATDTKIEYFNQGSSKPLGALYLGIKIEIKIACAVL